MSGGELAVLMLAMFVIIIMLGFPIAFTLMAMGLGFGYYAYHDPLRQQGILDNRVFDLFVQKTYGIMSSDVLVSIPLFLFMGYIIERSNVVDRLFKTLYIVTWRVPGAMALAAMFTCTLFGIASGIVGAVVALMGILAFPMMLKSRYDVSFASGVICAGGCLGILIPPSIMLIVYAQTASVSVVQLYAAAFIPGFLLAGLYMVYILVRAWLQPEIAPRPRREDIPHHSALQITWMVVTSVFPMAFLIFATLGVIMFGLATPTESAAIGAAGGILLAIMYRSLTWERLKESVYLTARTSAMVCWLFVGSGLFASVFAYMGGEALIKDWVVSLNLGPISFLILAQVIIFLLGYPLEWSEIIIIFVPIFLPLLPLFNVDPLLFGVLIAVNLQTSFLTPPVAMAAFYLKGIAPPSVTLTAIYKGLNPYVLMVFFCMLLLYVFPELALWLPNEIYGK